MEKREAVEDEQISRSRRICGAPFRRQSDPNSCTKSLSEECLAKALVAYWAAHGVKAAVALRDGFARLEGLAGATQSEDFSAQRWAAVEL
jgi:hypothetical protein